MGDHRDSDIGRRQADIRQRLGLTQLQMADRLGIPMRTLSDNERGVSTPGGRVLQTYARLGISVDWMITGEGRPFREGTSVGAIDLAELHGSTRIAIAVFDKTDVLDSYIVGSKERHRRARISLSPEIVEEMVPVRELGLPDECRLFGFMDATRNRIALIDANSTLGDDGEHLLIIEGMATIRRVQRVQSGDVVLMSDAFPDVAVSVQKPEDFEWRGRLVSRISLRNPKF